MIIKDEKGGPLYKYCEKDMKAAVAAVKWISEFPGVLLHIPDFDFTFISFFDEDQIVNFSHLCSADVRERLFAILHDEDFWDEGDSDPGEDDEYYED